MAYRQIMAVAIWLSVIGLAACTTVSAETSKPSRDTLIEAYVDAIKRCDHTLFAQLFHTEHRGYALRGSLDTGFDGPALFKQCDAGIKLDIQSHKTIWLSNPATDTQIVALELYSTLIHPKREPHSNNLKVSLVLDLDTLGVLKIRHSHMSVLR